MIKKEKVIGEEENLETMAHSTEHHQWKRIWN